jgi:hypothetical protein
MLDIEKISLNFSYSGILFVIGIIIAFLYAYYVYRYTLPPVSTSKRILLISLRGFALAILLFIFFEPILTLTKKKILEPINLVFIDNSKSIQIEDGTYRQSTIRSVTDQLINNTSVSNTELFLFGNRIETLDTDSLNQLDFTHSSTNFVDILNNVDPSKQNIASITIVSDGVITDGSNPIYAAQQKAIPVFTIGIGDSSQKKDIEIRSVLYNDLIYVETPTTIMSTITNRGFGGQNVMVSLYENDDLLDQRNFILDENGTNNIYFDYTPKSSGEKKISITVSGLKDEFTFANNKKIVYAKVLSNKIRVLIVSGSPSSDLTFIKNSLITDNNISVSSLTQIGFNQFIENSYIKSIDSADILFLIGFPTKETSPDALNLIVKKISEKNTPFFFTLSSDIDLTRLANLKEYLPFTISQIDNIYQPVQPEIQIGENNHPLLNSRSNDPAITWNNLPPILQPIGNMSPKPESKIVSRTKAGNVTRQTPLILTRSINKKRSIAVLAKDLWRWKLQTATRKSDLFDSFILNSVRWLNVADQFDKIKIAPTKKIFAAGEDVEFSARVYDDAMNPVTNSDVKVMVSKDQENFQINLSSVGVGLYEGKLQLRKPGDYRFSGEASLNGTLLGQDQGIFNIGEIDIEMLNPRPDYKLLNLLAIETGGEYFDPDEVDLLIKELKEISSNAIKEKFITSEISLWSSEFLLIMAILVFAIEWFVRKRAGML